MRTKWWWRDDRRATQMLNRIYFWCRQASYFDDLYYIPLCWNSTFKCIVNWILLSSPSCDVIVLSSPAPVLVRKAVHFEVLLRGYSRHPSEVLRVWKPAKESEKWFGEAQRNKVICLYYPSSIISSEVSQLPLQFNVRLYFLWLSASQCGIIMPQIRTAKLYRESCA